MTDTTEKPSKLLFLVNQFRMAGSGLENDSVKLCRALAARGYDVHVCCGKGSSYDDLTVVVDLPRHQEIIKELQPDLVIDWEMIAPADIHRMGGGTHRGFMPYNLRQYSGLARLIKQLKYRLPKNQKKIQREEAILSHPGDYFLPNSNQSAGMAIEGGADSTHVDTYYQSVDLELFTPDNAARYRNDIRQKLGITEDEIVFMYAAHNLGLKNFALLDSVFSTLKDHPKLKVMVVGKRKPKVDAPWLVYAGKTGAMEQFYAAADVFIHPTWFDSCANVVLEAMASGLPVLVSNTSGVYEIVRDGNDGRVLDVIGDPSTIRETWKQAIIELAENDALRQEQGGNARSVAEGHSFDRYLNWFEAYMVRVFADQPRISSTS